MVLIDCKRSLFPDRHVWRLIVERFADTSDIGKMIDSFAMPFRLTRYRGCLYLRGCKSPCASRDTFLVTPISTGGGLCYGHARIKDTRKTTTTNAPAEYDHASTGEEDVFCEPVASIDSWLFVEMLETDLRTLLGLAIVDSNSAKSCFVAMSLTSIADIEYARGFVVSIGVLGALLDEVWM